MQLDGFLLFFFVIILGYTAARCRLVPRAAAEALSPVLMNVLFPAMLLRSFSTTDPQALLRTGLPVVAATAVFSLLPFFVSRWLLRKQEVQRRALLGFISGVGNTSFVCIPLLSLFLGKEAMLIVFTHGAVMDFLIWGVHHQIFVGSGSRDWKKIAKKLCTSPCLLAVVTGIVLAVLHVQLPSFITTTLDALKAAVSPVALLMIGILICDYGALSWCKSPTAIYYTLWKVLVLPCLVFAVLYFFLPLRTALVLAIVFGSPAPVMGVLWCKQYGGDAALAVDCLVPSTLLYFLVMGGALLALTANGILV